ncbi:MAG: prepilin-type N-terminal cleavage/methylation domain-containing protein [Acidobacteria bacterium]|nr:prepilin-type N-terminal cleavage/methylation domain-containing protein [Acidobacteriota bacterium]
MKSVMPSLISQPGFRPRGFTLIEVLVSMGLLSAVLLSMAGFIVYGSNLLLKMEQVAMVSHILEKRVEYIRSKSFDEIGLLAASFTDDDFVRLQNAQGLCQVVNDSGEDIKKVILSVLWTFRGRTMRRDLMTLVTRWGVDKK